MKKIRTILCLLAVISMSALLFGGCGLFGGSGESPSPIDIPTSEPTGVPTVLDNSVLEGFIGDWYGVYTVAEARGVYAPNSGVKNDCAMRVAVDEFGRGRCYLQVNGMGRDAVSGSSNVFALCTAHIADKSLVIEGMINTLPIEWSFELIGGSLVLTEVYGDVSDHMRIEIALLRPDSFAGSGIAPEALDYFIEHGFANAIDMLGGSSAELPEVSVPDGCDPHLFFTADASSAVDTPAPTEIPGTVMSADGHIRLTLPDGYEVVSNTVMDFAVACPEKGILNADFTVSSWGTDSLSFLMGNTPNVTELYHYTIGGYDFYGTFLPASSEEPTATPYGTTVFKLCGTNGTGSLIIINITTSLDAYTAYTYVNVDNADFTKLILNAEFFD